MLDSFLLLPTHQPHALHPHTTHKHTHTPKSLPPTSPKTNPPPLPGSVNADYKSKLRSLAFNLRDAHNPDLRAHVLLGDIVPPSLVTMSPADLANKDLAEWRRKIEEEHNKAIELDVEAAAKVCTVCMKGGGWGWVGVRGWVAAGREGANRSGVVERLSQQG